MAQSNLVVGSHGQTELKIRSPGGNIHFYQLDAMDDHDGNRSPAAEEAMRMDFSREANQVARLTNPDQKNHPLYHVYIPLYTYPQANSYVEGEPFHYRRLKSSSMKLTYIFGKSFLENISSISA